MRGVRAIGMLAHESCALAYLRYGGVGEGVEEVVFSQDQRPPVSLGIDVVIRFERLIKTTAWCGRETALR